MKIVHVGGQNVPRRSLEVSGTRFESVFTDVLCFLSVEFSYFSDVHVALHPMMFVQYSEFTCPGVAVLIFCSGKMRLSVAVL